jgi:CheY-like chemotaxis protein
MSSSARRILVVDDNVDAAESFADLLNEMGHEVRIANDGKAALELNGEWQADVISLDIGLPGMDGYEVARQIRVQNPSTRLVALTGYGHESARSMSVEAGFARHLVKPPDYQHGRRVARDSCDGGRATAELSRLPDDASYITGVELFVDGGTARAAR